MFKLFFNSQRFNSLTQLTAALCACAIASSAKAECVPGAANDACAPAKVVGAWEKSVSGGLNVNSGNTDTTLLNLGASAHQEKDADIYDLRAAYSFGQDKKVVNTKGDHTTRNDLRAGARFDHLLNDRAFVGFGANYMNDEIADIDYRVSLDPSIGYYFLKDNSFKLRGEAGPSYVFERQGNKSDDYLAPRIGERFDWAITCTSKLFQTAEILFDASESDNYLVNAEIGTEAALATNLALVLTLRETYDNLPAAGRDKGDFAMISSLKVSF